MKFHFHSRYFILTLILLLIEILIAVYVHDDIVRPYIGDFLVVILLYCFVRTFVMASVLPVALCVLLFSFLIEAGQYFHFVSVLGLERSRVANIILGNSFAWIDLLMYTAGIVCVMVIENNRKNSFFAEINVAIILPTIVFCKRLITHDPFYICKKPLSFTEINKHCIHQEAKILLVNKSL